MNALNDQFALLTEPTVNFMALYSGPFFSEIYNPAGDEPASREARFESTTLIVMGISLGFGKL